MKKLVVSLATVFVLLAAYGVANAQPPANWVSPVETRIGTTYGLTPGLPNDRVFAPGQEQLRLLVLKKDGTQAMGDIFIRTVGLSRLLTIPVTDIVTDKESLRITNELIDVTQVVTLNYYIAEIIDGTGATVWVPVYLHGATLSGVFAYICGVEM